jgi:hypothetical protein
MYFIVVLKNSAYSGSEVKYVEVAFFLTPAKSYSVA